MRGLNLLALPHHGKVYQTKHKLRRRAEGRFHYTQVRQGWICHYSSDEPQVARPEWLLDQLIASEVVAIDESLVIVEALKFDNTYLCVVIEQGVVTQAWLQNEPNWTSLLVMNTEHRLLIGNVPGLEGKAYQLDNNFADRLAQYQLKAPSRFGAGALIAALFAGLVLIAGQVWEDDTPVEEVVVATVEQKSETPLPVIQPPWLEYRLKLLKGKSVEHTFQQSLILASYLSSLPPDWKASEMVFSGQHITTTIQREPNGLMSVMNAWLEQRSELARFVKAEQDRYAIVLPVGMGVLGWIDKQMPIEPSWQNLQDMITLMGFSLSEPTKESVQATWQKVSWEVSKSDASLGELAYLNSLLVKLPLSVNSLTLTHRADDIWDTTFNMTLYGGL